MGRDEKISIVRDEQFGVWSNSDLAKIARTVKEKSLETHVHKSNKQDSKEAQQ